MSEPSNAERLARVENTLEAYAQLKGDPPADEGDIMHLLTDLRHFAHSRGLDFTEALADSRENFKREIRIDTFVAPEFDGKRYVPVFNYHRDWWTIFDHTEKELIEDERDDDGDRLYTFDSRAAAQEWADDLNDDESDEEE